MCNQYTAWQKFWVRRCPNFHDQRALKRRLSMDSTLSRLCHAGGRRDSGVLEYKAPFVFTYIAPSEGEPQNPTRFVAGYHSEQRGNTPTFNINVLQSPSSLHKYLLQHLISRRSCPGCLWYDLLKGWTKRFWSETNQKPGKLIKEKGSTRLRIEMLRPHFHTLMSLRFSANRYPALLSAVNTHPNEDLKFLCRSCPDGLHTKIRRSNNSNRTWRSGSQKIIWGSREWKGPRSKVQDSKLKQ